MSFDRPHPSDAWRQSKSYPDVLARIVAEVRDNAPPSGQPFGMFVAYREWTAQWGERDVNIVPVDQFNAEWGPYEPTFRVKWRTPTAGDRYLSDAPAGRMGISPGGGGRLWIVVPDETETEAEPDESPAESSAVTCGTCHGRGRINVWEKVNGVDSLGERPCPHCTISWTDCDRCDGHGILGTVPPTSCPECNGSGTVQVGAV